MKEIRQWPEWYRIIQPKDLLDPESEYKFKAIPEGLFKSVQARAATLLVNQPNASALVRQHWQDIVAGKPPYGLLIEKRTKKGTVYVPNTKGVVNEEHTDTADN
jgi:hypothetical protein